MARQYPATMNSLPERNPVTLYRPKSVEPQTPVEKRRRREQVEPLLMPITDMLKELWHCRLQQCPVDSAGQISAWPPGQVSGQN